MKLAKQNGVSEVDHDIVPSGVVANVNNQARVLRREDGDLPIRERDDNYERGIAPGE